MTTQTFAFQTEVKQLLQLMIHSLYANKEIFLRELISNASDAADKLRFAALADPNLFEQDPNLKIQITLNQSERTITVADNGIGMSRDEVIEHLGTIAKSGTQAFLAQLPQIDQASMQLIGQFGVGFYAVFMVADKVTLKTRRAGLAVQEGVLWESDGEGEYQISHIDYPARGTAITLHLKKDADNFLSDSTLKRIIQTYSDHIAIPIEMKKGTHYDQKGQAIESDEMVAVNQSSALWIRQKNTITDEQYQSFYQHIAHDFSKPLAWSHATLEGKQHYTALLYVPSKAPLDLYDMSHKQNLKLYVKRVFIMEVAEQLLPNYLRFIKGIVDSDDLPLNVSREILQASSEVDAIKNGCTKKVLNLLMSIAKDRPDDYQVFWQAFGQVLKEGVVEDAANQAQIVRLIRFCSTHGIRDTANTTLSDYVLRMKKGQEKIYFITANSLNTAKNSPHLEVLRQKNIEVLLLVDRIDEWLMASLTDFEGKVFQSAAKGQLDLSQIKEDDDKVGDQPTEFFLQEVIDKIQQVLGDKVAKVRITNRLVDSPSCLVVDEKAMSQHLEQLLSEAGQSSHQLAKPILEINPNHPLVQWLTDESDVQRISDLGLILYDQARLMDGAKLDNPADFVTSLNRLMNFSAAKKRTD